ncbi:MAG TPA: hypothetical protein VNZ57_15710 [Longimicrobiales bacterium]|nr:hypothetical protein [Longimicrobiales bacterium]
MFNRYAVVSALALACIFGVVRPAQSQMMGGRSAQGSREAMIERLAGLTPEQRAYLEAHQEARQGTRITGHRVSLRVRHNNYSRETVAAPIDVSETVSELVYSLRRPGWSLRIAGGPLWFKQDSISITGLSAVDARLELAVASRDSLRFALRAPSSPTSLSDPEVNAVSALGTSAVDLASVQFGTPARISAGYTHVRAMGGSMLATLRAGADFEPKPSGSEAVYWRGTTVRGGVNLARERGLGRVGIGIEASYSFADSLGGNNLFQGGGTVLARADAATVLTGLGDVLVAGSASYFRPHSADRVTPSGLREPAGDFKGVSAVAIIPAGNILITPIVVVSSDASDSTSEVSTIEDSAWSMGTSVAVDIPFAGRFTINPEVGYATGSIRKDVVTGGQLDRRTYSLSGWWIAAGLSATF